MIYFVRIIGIVLLMSTFALAQVSDSEETLLEQTKALASEQSSGMDPVQPTSFSVEAVTHPLFVGVDDVNVPAYVGDPVMVDWDSVFVGVEVWGAAYDIDNNKIYVNDGADLYEWVVGSGTVTFLGTITDTSAATFTMVSLAFYNGILYGTRNIGNEAVYEINTSTFVATVFIDYSETLYDFGGLAADPNTGEFYGTSDDADSLGRGLYRINMDGTATLIAPYPDGQTDIDGLAFSDNQIAYLITDQQDSIYIYDLVGGIYLSPIANPWTSSEVFCGGAWIYEVGGGGTFPELIYYQFNEGSGTTTANLAVPGVGNNPASLTGTTVFTSPGQFGSAILGDFTANGGVESGWNVDLGTSDWTISMWLEIPTDPSGSAMYLFGDGGAGSFRCFHNGTALPDNLVLRGSGAGITDVFVNGIGPAPTVVTFVYDSSVPEIRTYKNGTFDAAHPQAALNFPVGTGFKVGGYGSSATMQGKMDEFRFYNRALSDAEIAATWNVQIPVELTSFTASVNNNDVTLNWETASEINNSGFQVERKSNGEYKSIGFVPGFGTTTESKAYSFSDANLNAGTYSYRLKQIDYDGTFEYSDPVEVDIIVPDVYSLHQNYPNPFNPSTKITFTLAANALVTLKVFDVLGQEVMTLINQDLTAGAHTYDFDAAGFNSGVYFYRIEANGNDGTKFTNVKKMILIK